MITKRRQKIFLTISGLIVIGAVSAFFFSQSMTRPSNWRRPASGESAMLVSAAIQIKTEVIQSIQWKDRGDEMELSLGTQDPDFCQKWTGLSMTMMADGVAVSGEAPQARLSTSICRDQHFIVTWPKASSKWTSPIEKVGDYQEEPSDFFVSQISLSGPYGQMKISNLEIETVLKETLTISSNSAESANPADSSH